MPGQPLFCYEYLIVRKIRRHWEDQRWNHIIHIELFCVGKLFCLGKGFLVVGDYLSREQPTW